MSEGGIPFVVGVPRCGVGVMYICCRCALYSIANVGEAKGQSGDAESLGGAPSDV